MKINTIIIITFLIVSISAVSGGSYYFYISSVDLLTEQVYECLDKVVNAKSDHITTALNMNLERLKLVSSRTKLRSSLDNYNENKNEEDKDMMKKILIDANESINDFENIFVLDLNGMVIVSINDNFENIDYSNEDFFIKGKEENNIFLVHNENNKQILYLSGPLLLDDKLLGVIVIISKADDIVEITQDYTGTYETMDFYLIDKNGIMLASSLFNEYTQANQKIDTLNARNCLSIAGTGKEKSYKGYSTSRVFTNHRGVNVIGTHVYIPEMQWCLLAEINEKESIGMHKDLLFGIYLVILSLIVFLIALDGFFVSRIISKPIKRLTEDVHRITRGDLDIRLKKSDISEVQELTESLNRILASLKLVILRTGVKKEELALGGTVKKRKKP